MKYLLLGIVPGLVHFEAYMVVPRPDYGDFQCFYCGSTHNLRQSARRHVVRFHIVPERFLCNICNEVVLHKFGFHIHMIRKHNVRGVGNVLQNYSTKLDQ